MPDDLPPRTPPADHRDAAMAASAAALRAARSAVDAEFGDGYAAAHPQLVAAMLQATAIESAVEAGRAATDQVLDRVTRLSRDTNETILKLKPRLFG